MTATFWNESWTAALVNHLWQSTFVVGIVWLLAIAFSKNEARVRYWIWFAASAKFLLPLSLLIQAGEWLRSLLAHQVVDQLAVTAAIQQIAQPFAQQQSFDPGAVAAPAHHAEWMPAVLLAVWACGAIAVIVRFAGEWWRAYSVKQSARPLNLAADVPVLVSAASMEPGIFGIVHPVLLLPQRILERLTAEQLRAIVAHEMAHVRRRDNLTFAIHMIVETLFWFHPAVWWIGARLIEDRELACDEAVVQSGGEAQVYAEGILRVCKLCVESPRHCVSGVTGADLKERIAKIMAGSAEMRLSPVRKLLLAAVSMVAIAGPLALGLAIVPHLSAQLLHAVGGKAPSFEVATIKPAKPDETALSFRLTPTYFYAQHASLMSLVKFAYDTQTNDQITGEPSWANNEFFDIEAKSGTQAAAEFRELPPGRKMEPTRLMVQSLLEERFHMRSRFKTENRPVYALVIAKGGLKLKPFAAPPSAPAKLSQDPGIQPPYKGNIAMYFTGAHQLTGRNAPINMLIGWLVHQPELGNRAVVDETGLRGGYDFVLDGVNRDHQPPPAAGMPVDPGPSIFTILQEQLGLKLVPKDAPVEVLVIDHIDQPTPN